MMKLVKSQLLRHRDDFQWDGFHQRAAECHALVRGNSFGQIGWSLIWMMQFCAGKKLFAKAIEMLLMKCDDTRWILLSSLVRSNLVYKVRRTRKLSGSVETGRS